VIANSSFVFGIEEMTGGGTAFVNFTRNVLLHGYATLLPRQSTVIELLEHVEPDEQIIEACGRLKKLGFSLALDDFVYHPRYDSLLELVDIVKVDFLTVDAAGCQRLADAFIPRGIKMLAEKVETQEDYRRALDMGYSYFQGYFFSKPVVVVRKDIPTNRFQYLRILQEISAIEIDFPRLARTIQEDASICYKLLKYTNSAAFGLRRQVTSILQALALIGEEEFRKLVALLSLGGLAGGKPTELILCSLVRAKACELIAPSLGISTRRSDFFLLGLFSLLDAIMDQPLIEVLAAIHLDDDLRAALLDKHGRMGTLLTLVIAYEKGAWGDLPQLAATLQIDESVLPPFYLQAVQWAREIYNL
jgi:EAL and modified HD-GYP domain-containing signal transduction protein